MRFNINEVIPHYGEIKMGLPIWTAPFYKIKEKLFLILCYVFNTRFAKVFNKGTSNRDLTS